MFAIVAVDDYLPGSQSAPRRITKRRRSASPADRSSPAPVPTTSRRDAEDDSSLPPSSPPAPFSDTDDSLDERDTIHDADEVPEEEEDGEDLFGENLNECVELLFRCWYCILQSRLEKVSDLCSVGHAMCPILMSTTRYWRAPTRGPARTVRGYCSKVAWCHNELCVSISTRFYASLSHTFAY